MLMALGTSDCTIEMIGTIFDMQWYICISYVIVTSIEVIGNSFPTVWEILPEALGRGHYFPNFGKAVSSNN